MDQPRLRDSTPSMPSFPKPPRSELFSKLEQFLPKLAEENKKLEEAVSAGRGDLHNIEIEEHEGNVDEENGTQSANHVVQDESEDEHTAGKPKQIIEMNFALGVMADSESEEEAEDRSAPMEIDELSHALAKDPAQEKDGHLKLQLPGSNASSASGKRPLIQELK